MRAFTLEGKLVALLFAAAMLAAALAGALGAHWGDGWLAALVAVAALALPLVWIARTAIAPIRRLLRALSGSVASYRDGDYSLSLASRRGDELGALIQAHNALGQALRGQRQNLVQRELLLDTVMQHTPTALLLVDPHLRVVYANLAARHLLNDGKSPLGMDFAEMLQACPAPMREALASGNDSLTAVTLDGAEEMFHISSRDFRLQGRPHRLHLVQRMTRELSRQEVAAWKRVIRVISHELNNSLAPISSLAHSGTELARRGDSERLPQVFAGIGERARHLHDFIAGYADFARLPAPRRADVAWAPFVEGLRQHAQFQLEGDLPKEPGWFDAAQVEQVLLNLLKNAHESGSAADAIRVRVTVGVDQRIEVLDCGPGMNETVLAQALLPFYSTKRSGTGLGLALAREITEAHGGRITLANRDGGGLRVMLQLPRR
ncbi:MAG TPA: ATP-binding protein [Rudaea sp.]|jgi:nitrogen fixation/metabolism regulation signal transduction histidine kinase|nr:ATP-binding protein [Rudaea sp.]